MSKLSILAVAAITLIPSIAAVDCNKLPACVKSGMADACKKAVQRWEANGIYETNSAALIARSAKSGSLTCVAQMKCDSSGGFHRFIGSDVRSLFNSILSQCGSCGDVLISGASNCWLQIVGCENCDIPDEGSPVGHVSSSTKPPTSTKKSSVPPPPTTKKTTVSSTKKPTVSSTKKSSTPLPPLTTTKNPSTISSTKKSSTVPPPSTSKKPDPPPNTTKKPDPPPTTKQPGQPSSTPEPQPDQEERDTEDAENANDEYQKDPTNKSLAEKLKSAIEKALDSVKKAVEDAVDEAIKGAEEGLQKALQSALTEAAAAAAAPTAAAAAATAAAMEAVSSAKDAVKQAKHNKPTQKPTDKPTTKGPTTTFSTSTSSSSTSTSTSSSVTCVCLSCGEAQLDLGDAVEEKRSNHHNGIRTDRRASTRKTSICQDWTVPEYNSWSKLSPGSNTYSPFYDSSYATNMRSCTDVDYDLTTPAGGRPSKNYATEHIYEIQMVKQFLTYMWLNDGAIGAWRKQPANAGKDQCDLWAGLLWADATGHKWWDDEFISPSPIEHVLEQLSGGGRPGEMVYLEHDMNSIKGVMFGERRSWSFAPWNKQLAAAARMGATILYLQDANVRGVYHAASRRMYDAWRNFDIEVSEEHPDADLKRVQFADGYLRWEKQFIERMEDAWKTRPGSEAKDAEDKIRNNQFSSGAERKVADNIKAQRENANGKFNAANLLFAQGLLAWFPGTRP